MDWQVIWTEAAPSDCKFFIAASPCVPTSVTQSHPGSSSARHTSVCRPTLFKHSFGIGQSRTADDSVVVDSRDRS